MPTTINVVQSFAQFMEQIFRPRIHQLKGLCDVIASTPGYDSHSPSQKRLKDIYSGDVHPNISKIVGH